MRLDVEFRTEHLDVAGEGLDHEGVLRIVRHLEEGLAVEPHAALPVGEEGRIAQLGAGVHADLRAVGQHQVDPLSGRNRDGIARARQTVVAELYVEGRRAERHEHHGGIAEQTTGPAEQLHPRTARRGTLRIRQHQHRVEEAALREQLAAAFGVAVDFVEQALLLLDGGLSIEKAVEQFFVHSHTNNTERRPSPEKKSDFFRMRAPGGSSTRSNYLSISRKSMRSGR